jgi:pimeloyl-ACP methyl ester carboxylesterase
VVILGLSGTRADFTTIKANVASTFFTPYTNSLTASQDSLWAHLLSWSPPAVQLGIANLWRSHAPLVQKSIETALDGSSNKQIYVLICGHSLGGAVAQLAGVDLARYLAAKGISHVVQVAAFNPPKVGNRSFVQLAEETLSHFNPEKGLRSSFSHHRPMLKLVKFHRQGDVIRLFPLLSTEIHDFSGIPVDEPRYAVNLTAPAPSGSVMDKHSLTRWLTHDLVGQSVIYRSGDDNFLAKAFKYSVKAAYAPHLLSEPEIQVGHELYFQSYRFW